MSEFYSFKVNDLHHEPVDLSIYKGKIILVVNTASVCGYTRQLKELENLYREFQKKGFVVLGFPCDQFKNQEFGTEEEIKEFCTTQYDITFPMFEKTKVKGKDIHPLFDYLTSHKRGFLWTKTIKWNFTKFLINKDGEVVKRYSPKLNPKFIIPDILNLLSKK